MFASTFAPDSTASLPTSISPLTLEDDFNERIPDTSILPSIEPAISELEQIPVENLLKDIRNRGLVPHVCTYLSDERKAIVEHSIGSVSVITKNSLQPLEWLARYICNLPFSGIGDLGVKNACLD